MATDSKPRRKKFEHLADQLRQVVQSKQGGSGEAIGTEHGLVRQTGYSRQSVRRAVDLLIDEGLVERRAGLGIFCRRNERPAHQVHMIVPSMEGQFTSQIVRGVLNAAKECSVAITLHDAHGESTRDLEMIKSLPAIGAEGAIVLASFEPQFPDLIYSLQGSGFPLVVADRWMWQRVPSVLPDYKRAGREVGRALVDLGHQRIGFVGRFHRHTVRGRIEGIREILEEAGGSFDRSLICDLGDEYVGPPPIDRIPPAVGTLCDRDAPPTAIAFETDEMAARGMLELKGRGLRIPQDVSVVGFGNDEMCPWLTPSLSSIGYVAEEIGRTALSMVVQLIRGWEPTDHAASRNRLVEVEWHPRDSIGPCPR